MPKPQRSHYRIKLPESEKVVLELTTAQNKIFHGNILNINSLGIGIYLPDEDLEKNLSNNEPVSIKFNLFNLGEITTTAKIIHIENNMLGLKFDSLKKDDLDTISDAFRKLRLNPGGGKKNIK